MTEPTTPSQDEILRLIDANQALREERDRLRAHVGVLLQVIHDYQETVRALAEKRAAKADSRSLFFRN